MRNEDYHCCPSISGTFEYDPFKFEPSLISAKLEELRASLNTKLMAQEELYTLKLKKMEEEDFS
jgi:hypothetical protein